MNRRISVSCIVVCASVLMLTACKQTKVPATPEAAAPVAATSALSTDGQRIGYALGASVGRQFRTDGIVVDADALLRGVREGYTTETLSLKDDEIKKALEQLQREHAEQQKAKQDELVNANKTASEAFLKQNGANADVVTTASGLQYKVVTAGKGPKPAAEETVTVQYRGTLIDGTEFDSSIKRGQPATFPVKGVIPGWTEALQLMPVGSKWMLYIPSDLAYGPGGAGGLIGPNAALVFEVELLSIEPKAAKNG